MMARNVILSGKNKGKGLAEKQILCADCNLSDPEWASINRGILVCKGCCSVHRSLGRHVSQIKLCSDKDWHPNTWSLVCALSSGGANSVWEHTLLDPGLKNAAKKKPHFSDPVHPTKADFIRAKHQSLSYIVQPAPLDERPLSADASGDDSERLEDEASQELHSSVRTANLETSLRLLSQGANPNYFHKGRGNYPLHVAAAAGQIEQVELMLSYGALPQCVDTNGNTAAHVASSSGYPDLANRLHEVQYEVLNRLVRYLNDQYTNTPPHSTPYSEYCTVPDGGSDSMFLSPQLLGVYQSSSEQSRKARSKLISMPCVLLEELAADLYDEVDRRELEKQSSLTIQSTRTVSQSADLCTVPFLPVNPLLSSTRNQARQKLARLKETEFCSLIVDLLVEARRRAAITSKPPSIAAGSAISPFSADGTQSEEEPLYDSVCSEDDYSLVEQMQKLHEMDSVVKNNNNNNMPLLEHRAIDEDGALPDGAEALPSQVAAENTHEDRVSSHDSLLPPVVVVNSTSPKQQVVTSTCPTPPAHSPSVTENSQPVMGVSLEQYQQMKEALEASNKRIKELQTDNTLMKTQLEQLTNTVALLTSESDHQRAAPVINGNKHKSLSNPHHHHRSESLPLPNYTTHPTLASPTHHYEVPVTRATSTVVSSTPSFGGFSPSVDLRTPHDNASHLNNNLRPYSMFNTSPSRGESGGLRHSVRETGGVISPGGNARFSPNSEDWRSNHRRSASYSEERTTDSTDQQLPTSREVIAITEHITRSIQSLLVLAQAAADSSSPSPHNYHSQLIANADNINMAVQKMAKAFPRSSSSLPPPMHTALVSLLRNTLSLTNECQHGGSTQALVQAAYTVAQATKNLISCFQ